MTTAAHTARYDLQADMVADAIRNGDQVADIMARRLLHIVLTMTRAGMVRRYHSVLTARIMAGASAQWHGTRTAALLLISGRYY